VRRGLAHRITAPQTSCAQKAKREGTGYANCGGSRGTLHEQEQRGARGLRNILEVETYIQLGGAADSITQLHETSAARIEMCDLWEQQGRKES